jgi:hypothetical protein
LIITRVQEALRFFWRFLGPLFAITLPFVAITEAVEWWQGPVIQLDDAGRFQQFTTISALTLVLIQPFSEGALIARLDALQKGAARSLGDCVLVGVRVAPALLLTYTLLAVGVYVGLLMLILPGLWIYARLSLAGFLVTLEDCTPVQALQSSFERTAGTVQWQLLGALAVLAILVFSILNLLGGAIHAGVGEQPVVEALLGILAALGGTLLSVLLFRFYGLTRPGAPDRERDPELH